MWFGIAPSPAPSPSRTNTQAWHPPHCTCARHRKAQAQDQQPHSHTTALSPRQQLLDAKVHALPLTGRDDKLRSAVPAPASLGPLSPRAPRRQRKQQVRTTRKPQEQSKFGSFLGRADIPMDSSRTGTRGDSGALWDSLDAVTLAPPSTKAGRDVAEEPAVGDDDKQPQEEDARAIYSSGGNEFGYTLAADEADNNSSTSERLSTGMDCERKASRSGRRVSRGGVDWMRNTERPPTGYADSSDAYR